MRGVLFVTALGFGSFALTLSALPAWAVDSGSAAGSAGLATTVMLGFTVVAQGLVPKAIRHFGTGSVLIAGLLFLGLPAPFYLINQDLWWLLVVSALRGIGFAVLTVLGSAMTARSTPKPRLGEAIGLYGLAIAVPSFVAVPLGVFLTLAGHFTVVAIASAMPVLAVPAVSGLIRAMPDAPVRADLNAAVPLRAVVLAVAAPSLTLFLVTMAGGGLLTFLPVAKPEGNLAAVSLLIFGATAALARWRAGVVAGRFGVVFMLLVSLISAIVGMSMVGWGLLIDPGRGASEALLLGSGIFGAGYGATQNLTLMLALIRAHDDNVASAVWNICFDGGTGLGAFAVGMIAATGLGIPWAFVVSALLMLVGLPLALGKSSRGT